MNEDLERMARAIDSEAFTTETEQDYFSTLVGQGLTPKKAYDRIRSFPARRTKAIRAARAVLEALREPSEAMLSSSAISETTKLVAKAMWQAMIGHLLAE